MDPYRPSRRAIVTAAAGLTLALPAISLAQVETVRIGHLTPLTGPFATLGGYAQLGIRLAADEINAAGGIGGRKVELMMEDSSRPEGGAAQAERLVARDKVAALVGEISSVSALAIAQVANRTRTVLLNTGASSDALRGKDCQPFLFHVAPANTMMAKAVGAALRKEGMVSGKRWIMLTADDPASRELLAIATGYVTANGGQVSGEERVTAETTDFGPAIQRIRQVRPEVVCPNLLGTQLTRFLKTYAESGLSIPIAGFGFDMALGWAAGPGNMAGTWPLAWHPLEDPSSKAFVEAFLKAYGKPPDAQSWSDYVALKLVARSFAELKSTESAKLAEHLRKGATFDILKGRACAFRAHDNQLMQPLYVARAKEPAKMSDRWDIMDPLSSVPSAGESLDVLAPDPDTNCKMPA